MSRSTGFATDSQIFRLSDLAAFRVSRIVAAADDDDRRLAADAAKILQHLAAGMLAERKIEADTVERGFQREPGGFLVSRGAGRGIAGFGRDPANDLAVEIIVVDDEEARQSRRLRLRDVSRARCVDLQ